MNAFAEWFCCRCCGTIVAGMVRAGPKAEKFEDPYDMQCTFVVIDGIAVLKGLATKVPVTSAHERAARRVLNAEGLKVRWDRIGGKSKRRQVIQTDYGMRVRKLAA